MKNFKYLILSILKILDIHITATQNKNVFITPESSFVPLCN